MNAPAFQAAVGRGRQIARTTELGSTRSADAAIDRGGAAHVDLNPASPNASGQLPATMGTNPQQTSLSGHWSLPSHTQKCSTHAPASLAGCSRCSRRVPGSRPPSRCTGPHWSRRGRQCSRRDRRSRGPRRQRRGRSSSETVDGSPSWVGPPESSPSNPELHWPLRWNAGTSQSVSNAGKFDERSRTAMRPLCGETRVSCNGAPCEAGAAC